jgi:hypothetical protein
MIDNRFNFGVTLDIDQESFEKATKGSKKDKYDNMVVWGRASDDAKDQEGQTLYPSGYDFADFLVKGLVNLEHFTARKASAKYWIGEPIEAHVKGEEFFVKAKLWKHKQEARDFYDTVVAMKESGSTRKPGWSIEGKSIEKDPYNPNRILKAKILNIAVTMSPVNQNSWLDIAKGQQSQDYIEPVVDKFEDQPYLFQYELEDGSMICINKDMSIKVTKSPMRKAMDTGSIAPLMPESLDGKVKNLESVKSIVKAAESGQLNKALVEKIFRKSFLNQ